MRAYLAVVCVAVIMAVPTTVSGAMMHLTTNYAAQQTTVTPGVGVPFDVYLYADDLTNGGLSGAEFRLTIPPTIIALATTVLHTGLNVGTPPDYVIGYPSPVLEPADLIWLTLLDVGGLPDQLIEIGPVTFPSLPGGTPVVADPFDPGILYPVNYSSGLLINPSGQIPAPAWTPEPTTMAILGLGSVALLGGRRASR